MRSNDVAWSLSLSSKKVVLAALTAPRMTSPGNHLNQ